MRPPILSIIVVTSFGVRELVLRCLATIFEQAPEMPLEVFLVDNASPDDTVAAVRERFPAVTVIANAINVGFAPANNQALAMAQGRYILFLNPDTEVGPGTLQACVDELERDPDVGMVGCRLVLSDGRTQYEGARRHYRLRHLVVESLWLHMFFPRHPSFAHHLMGDWDHTGCRDVESISGAFMMVRREIAQALGGLPQVVFLYHEDLSFCVAVQKAGWRTRYLGSVHIVHHANQSTRRGKLRWGLLEGEVKLRVIREFQGPVHAAVGRVVLAARSLARMGIAIVGYLPGMGGVRDRYPKVFHLQLHALLLVWSVAPVLVRPLMPKPITESGRPRVFPGVPTRTS